ncbi:MAG: lysine transporter LysE [Betaproteobacteria bacterium]|nr:lysine transporter LysE [Betaproteobacteria bacterium]
MLSVAELGVADYWAFVVAVIVFLAIPGVGNLAIITSTSKGRIPGGLAATLGVIVADQVLMWLAVAGVAAILTSQPTLFGIVQYAGAIYLSYLGVRMILAKPGDAPVLDMQPRRYFQQAMLITLLNPKAIVFYMAFFPLFVDPARHQGLLTFGVMAATIALLTLLYCVTLMSLVHFAAERVRGNPRLSLWLNRIAGTMLVGFGVKLAVGK